MKKLITITALLLTLSIALTSCLGSIGDFVGGLGGGNSGSSYLLEDVPPFDGETPFVVINDNKPFFTEKEITNVSFESYSDLDSLSRCGVAAASVGLDLMPTESRGSIGNVKPSGWHSVKYDIVDGKYLYNRCHLIGFQLTGENANKENLITGTRYLNIEGMLTFENMVADYVKETGNHVMYRVTPIFEGNNLVASGVLIEALSVEDGGAGIQFCVYSYNAQPGIVIDYETGLSALSGEPIPDSGSKADEELLPGENGETHDYVLNTSTMKFHHSTCSYAASMSEKNKQNFHGAREELIEEGYSPCSSCKP